MKVTIETIPHECQRYPTVGDWWWEGDNLQIRVSELGDWRKEMAVAFHELFEVLACKASGITQETVDEFDMSWTPHDDIDEPGDDPKAPYHREHLGALKAEMSLADALGLDWTEHGDAIKALP
jgi:hypothetical protein